MFWLHALIRKCDTQTKQNQQIICLTPPVLFVHTAEDLCRRKQNIGTHIVFYPACISPILSIPHTQNTVCDDCTTQELHINGRDALSYQLKGNNGSANNAVNSKNCKQ